MLNASTPCRQRGFTLTELMISIALGLIVLTGLVYMLSATMRTNTDTLRTTHLNQELRAVVQMMSRDLKRAGYIARAENLSSCASETKIPLSAVSGTITATLAGGNAACINLPIATGSILMNIVNVSGTLVAACATVSAISVDSTISAAPLAYSTYTITATNATCPGAGAAVPFASTTLALGAWTFINPFHSITLEDVASDGDSGDDCVLFSYDANDDGVVDTNERYGYRLNATEGSIETGAGVTSCTAGTWENLTEESGVEITNLDVVGVTSTNSSADVEVCIRELQLELTGRLTSDNTVTRTIEESVKVRNDLIIESTCPAM